MRILILLIALLVPVSGWAATYYVDASRPDDTGNGLSWATAKKTLDAARALLTNTGDTVLVLAGTYTGPGNWIQLISAGRSNCTWAGISTRGSVSDINARDVVVINGVATNGIANISIPNVTIKNMTLKATTSTNALYGVTGATNLTIKNVVLTNEASSTKELAFLSGGVSGDIKLDQVHLKNKSTVSSVAPYIVFDGSFRGSVNNSIFESTDKEPQKAIHGTGYFSGSASINNSTSLSGNLYGVHNESVNSGSINLRNVVVSSGGSRNVPGVTLYNSGNGTISVYTSRLLASPFNTNYTLGSGISIDSDTADNIGINPKYARYGKRGYVIPKIGENLFNKAQGLEPLLLERGMKGIFAIIGKDWSASNNSALREMVARGVIEPISHSYNHIAPNATTVGTMVYTGSGANPEYKIDLANNTFSVRADSGATDSYTATLSVDNFDKLSDVMLTVRANTNNRWNIVYTTYDVAMSGDVRVSSMSPVGWTGISTPIALNLTFDLSVPTSGYYWDEVKKSKDFIEGIVGDIIDPNTGDFYKCNTYATPGGVAVPNLKTATRTAGYTSLQYFAPSQWLTNYDLYAIDQTFAMNLIGSTADETKSRTRAIAYNALNSGRLIILNDDVGSVSTANYNGWPAILDALQEFYSDGLIVTSMYLAVKSITSSPWTYDSATGVSTRTWTGQADYRLRPGSPLIKAGTPISGLTTDFAGKNWENPPSIGAYEFYRKGGSGWGNFGLGW